MASNSDPVVLTREDEIAVIELNRPDKLNAVNVELATGLADAVENADDGSIRGVVLTGRGTATCAGMDLDGFESEGLDYADQLSEALSRVDAGFRALSVPSVMAAKRAVVGAGFGLSLDCDFVVLGDDTTLSLPEIQYGVVVGTDTLEQLSDVVGSRMALEIAITGGVIPPERALEIGLVNRVVPEDAVDERAREFLGTIMEHDPETVADVKENARAADII